MQIKPFLVVGLLASAQATVTAPQGDVLGSLVQLNNSMSAANSKIAAMKSTNILSLLVTVFNLLEPIIGQLSSVLDLLGLSSAKAVKRSGNCFESEENFELCTRDLMDGKRDYINLGGVVEEANYGKRDGECKNINPVDGKTCMDEFLIIKDAIFAAAAEHEGVNVGDAVQSVPTDSTAMPVNGGSISSRAISKRVNSLAADGNLCGVVQDILKTLQQLLNTILGKNSLLNNLLSKLILGGLLSTLQTLVNPLLSGVAGLGCQLEVNNSSGGILDLLNQILAILKL